MLIGLVILFVVFPILLIWLAFRFGLLAQKLAKRQQHALPVYPLEQVLRDTYVPEAKGVWPPPPTENKHEQSE